MGKPADLIQGTLDLLILKTIALEPRHGWAIAKRIQQMSRDVLQVTLEPQPPGPLEPRASGMAFPAVSPSRTEAGGWCPGMEDRSSDPAGRRRQHR